jgi:hypothetical protein
MSRGLSPGVSTMRSLGSTVSPRISTMRPLSPTVSPPVSTPRGTGTTNPTVQDRVNPNTQLLLEGRWPPANNRPTPPRNPNAGATAPNPPAPQAQRLPRPDPRQTNTFFDLAAGGAPRKREQGADIKGSRCVQLWDPSTHMSRQSWAATCSRVDQGLGR